MFYEVSKTRGATRSLKCDKVGTAPVVNRIRNVHYSSVHIVTTILSLISYHFTADGPLASFFGK